VKRLQTQRHQNQLLAALSTIPTQAHQMTNWLHTNELCEVIDNQ